ncbi:hypothetical protein QMK19_30545 [Streptomyces sp. H10-C2]|uniref:hypothetical protein n=1 Tax=unclassified Streptomyces TaxID=2593676 RepID=UPI0024BAFA1B|nr:MULTISPECIES: hypothetical protein [unclassified Streptomyces]MDJ0345960.1 hypothetical protein [Streptomyces sp. PH10-H1]MDJ0373873.1 hypothetical protein [Streptomyces sp. H10-C2]
MKTDRPEPTPLTHPGLTIAVYRVDEQGQRTTVQAAQAVPAGNVPITGQWPLCRCERCRNEEPIR